MIIFQFFAHAFSYCRAFLNSLKWIIVEQIFRWSLVLKYLMVFWVSSMHRKKCEWVISKSIFLSGWLIDCSFVENISMCCHYCVTLLVKFWVENWNFAEFRNSNWWNFLWGLLKLRDTSLIEPFFGKICHKIAENLNRL